MTVKASPAEGARRAESRIADMRSSVVGPGDVFDLPQYNLKVIKMTGGRDSAPAMARADHVRSVLSSQPDLSPGPSVYEVTATAQTGGPMMIPIGEVLVRFKAGTPEEGKRRPIE